MSSWGLNLYHTIDYTNHNYRKCSHPRALTSTTPLITLKIVIGHVVVQRP